MAYTDLLERYKNVQSILKKIVIEALFRYQIVVSKSFQALVISYLKKIYFVVTFKNS